MAAPKKRLITTVSFGKETNFARNIVEEYIRQGGDVSKKTRELWVWWGSADPKYLEFKKLLLIGEHKDLGRQISKLINKREKLRSELKELNVDWTNLEE